MKIGGIGMQEKRYTIKEASEILALESHTLRYYEDELELTIGRNSMGHRYYSTYDINLFRHIMELREQGLQLKAIKNAIQDLEESAITKANVGISSETMIDITDVNNTKVEQFRLMMKETFVQAIYENQLELRAELNHHIEDKIEKEMKQEIQKMEEMFEEKDEERYRKIDETMREMQKMRRDLIEIAEQKKNKKSFLKKVFGKKNIGQEEYVLKE